MKTFQETPPALTHFTAMMGPLGLYQHAQYSQPRLEEGYCTDDNARAVQLLVEWRDTWGTITAEATACLERCWQFVVAAQMPDGRFRNFRSVKGQWLDRGESEDTQARTVRALATIITSRTCSRKLKTQAETMLTRSVPQLRQLVHPRSIAETIIALATLPDNPPTNSVLEKLWHTLWQQWQQHADPAWPWPEQKLTYASALLPHGLLVGASKLNRLDPVVEKALKTSVAWLIDLTTQQGYFVPISTAGHDQQSSQRVPYDQQPIEAHTMLDLLIAYTAVIKPPVPSETLQAPYRWFQGHNSQNVSLVDHRRGACYDGLTPHGVNQNQGAESLLAYLRTEVLMARYRAEA